MDAEIQTIDESISFLASIRKGEGGKATVSARSPKEAAWLVGKFRDGQEVNVTVSSRMPTRTQQQNRWLWGVYYRLISDETGFSAADIHEWAKQSFLGKGNKLMFGRPVILNGSTTRLTKIGFQQYVEKIAEATGIEPPTDEYAQT